MKKSKKTTKQWQEKPIKWGVLIRLIKYGHLRFLFWGRLAESSSNPVIRKIAVLNIDHYSNKTGNEIYFWNRKIGGGLQLCHPYGITVNPEASLGDNVVLFKGCTIGSIRSGKREGVPCVGNNEVIGCNAMICGGITIGNDTLIASNSFVDFDVPENSIVIGNPGVIHTKENPTTDYIRRFL